MWWYLHFATCIIPSFLIQVGSEWTHDTASMLCSETKSKQLSPSVSPRGDLSPCLALLAWLCQHWKWGGDTMSPLYRIWRQEFATPELDYKHKLTFAPAWIFTILVGHHRIGGDRGEKHKSSRNLMCKSNIFVQSMFLKRGPQTQLRGISSEFHLWCYRLECFSKLC